MIVDAAVWERDSDSSDGGAHARGALANCGLGQADDVHAGQHRADPDLDLDGHAVDTEQGGAQHARHGRLRGDRVEMSG